ncbi:hypothetical protein C823_003117 [Eubacterium plexicaudatum ASF492]|nr:hypothetical protein C823_003117 [Eubacterium plexicaudatum ASF492]
MYELAKKVLSAIGFIMILECVLKLLSVNCASQFAGDLSRMREA